MVFRVCEFSQLKGKDPERWKAMVRISIQKHNGVLKRVANDLDVGYSSLKRWVADEPEFKRHLKAVRKAYSRERA